MGEMKKGKLRKFTMSKSRSPTKALIGIREKVKRTDNNPTN